MATKEFLNDVNITGDLDVTGTLTSGSLSVGGTLTLSAFMDTGPTAQTIPSSITLLTGMVTPTTYGTVSNWITMSSNIFTITTSGVYILNAIQTVQSIGGDERLIRLYLRDDADATLLISEGSIHRLESQNTTTAIPLTFLIDAATHGFEFNFACFGVQAGDSRSVKLWFTISKV